MTKRLAAGCMTGTSIDGIDVAILEISGTGLGMRAKLLNHASRPLGDLAPRLRKIAQQHACTAREFAATARDLGSAHADALRDALAGRKPDLIAVHGQTVYHAPPLSWQLINPQIIAEAIGAPVVFDLRAADLAAGGRGAPLTPIADWVLFASPTEMRAVVNLGGFCNITRLPRREAVDPIAPDDKTHTPADFRPLDQISGGDVCVCNQLLDALARRCLDRPIDFDGRAALGGHPREPAVSSLLQRLERQSAAQRSLGTGDEIFDWIDEQHGAGSPSDLARSACVAIARTIGRRLTGVDRVILAGGGAKNAALVCELGRACDAPLSNSADLGIPVESREAACFAILGALSADRVPIALPRITGAPAPRVAGAWIRP